MDFDLGMHRNADDRRCPAQDQGPSIPIFSALKFEERRRIWFGYVVIESARGYNKADQIW